MRASYKDLCDRQKRFEFYLSSGWMARAKPERRRKCNA